MRSYLTLSLTLTICGASLPGCGDDGKATSTEGSTGASSTTDGGSTSNASTTTAATSGPTTTEGSISGTSNSGSTSDATTLTSTTGPETSTTDVSSTGNESSTSTSPGSSSDGSSGGGSTTDNPGQCPPTPNDTECTKCAKMACCDESLACAADLKCSCFTTCFAMGKTAQQCAMQCMINGPTPALMGLFTCEATNCMGTCPLP